MEFYLVVLHSAERSEARQWIVARQVSCYNPLSCFNPVTCTYICLPTGGSGGPLFLTTQISFMLRFPIVELTVKCGGRGLYLKFHYSYYNTISILEPEILGNHNINTGTNRLLKAIVNQLKSNQSLCYDCLKFPARV